jgi:hypothetical protein
MGCTLGCWDGLEWQLGTNLDGLEWQLRTNLDALEWQLRTNLDALERQLGRTRLRAACMWVDLQDGLLGQLGSVSDCV